MSTAVIATSAAPPSPAERPQADVVIYDGHCRFCQASVRWLRWFDRGNRLAYLSLHDPEVAKRYPHLTHEALMKEMYLVDRSGRDHHGAESWRYLTRRLPVLWILAPILNFPFTMPLWNWIYARIAKHRYLFFGKAMTCDDGACKLG